MSVLMSVGTAVRTVAETALNNSREDISESVLPTAAKKVYNTALTNMRADDKVFDNVLNFFKSIRPAAIGLTGIVKDKAEEVAKAVKAKYEEIQQNDIQHENPFDMKRVTPAYLDSNIKTHDFSTVELARLEKYVDGLKNGETINFDGKGRELYAEMAETLGLESFTRSGYVPDFGDEAFEIMSKHIDRAQETSHSDVIESYREAIDELGLQGGIQDDLVATPALLKTIQTHVELRDNYSEAEVNEKYSAAYDMMGLNDMEMSKPGGVVEYLTQMGGKIEDMALESDFVNKFDHPIISKAVNALNVIRPDDYIPVNTRAELAATTQYTAMLQEQGYSEHEIKSMYEAASEALDVTIGDDLGESATVYNQIQNYVQENYILGDEPYALIENPDVSMKDLLSHNDPDMEPEFEIAEPDIPGGDDTCLPPWTSASDDLETDIPVIDKTESDDFDYELC